MSLNDLIIFIRKMTSSSSICLMPVGVRGMKVLDRQKFTRTVNVPVLKVKEEALSKITQPCKAYFLKLENFKPVQNLEGDNLFNKCIFFNPEIIAQWMDICGEHRKILKENEVGEQNFQYKQISLSYDNWKIEAIFKSVLPENEEIVSSFSQIGHIVHLNLRGHLIEYRQLIGQVLIDKIKTCRTVVNKSNIIDNTYRNFSMEVVAGIEDFFVTVKENRCIFQFDFSKVYWNPRLGKEHERILSYLKPEDVLIDVFCGVGPFSIPAAKKRCKVYANDLNPDSYKWLNHNAKNNKVNLSLFKSFNQDGKDFICSVFKDYITSLCSGDDKIDQNSKIHITMNLPAMAVEFLQYFNGLIKNKDMCAKFDYDIIVYVYCFAVGDNPVETAKQMVNDKIGCDISPYILDIFDVRNVSPKKEMMRVTFKLTKEILCNIENDKYEPPNKKLCA